MIKQSNMITLCKNSDEFLNITDKLEEVKNCELNKNTLYSYMIGGLHNRRTLAFASHDKGKMNGCLVITLINLHSNLCLNILFVWIDKNYTKLWREYMKFVEEKAKEFKVKRIIVVTKRNAEVIERKFGKFGYKAKYNIVVKEMS